jgi:predicted transglutaminase-like cysteine proteinase
MTTRIELISQINFEVNQFTYSTDMSVWGQPDYWERISQQSRGDCDDYVMEKRWRCLEAGIPLEDMRIGICTVETGESHAVLIVNDPELGGDWILDNRQPVPYTMIEFKGLGYIGVSIQHPGHWLWQTWT